MSSSLILQLFALYVSIICCSAYSDPTVIDENLSTAGEANHPGSLLTKRYVLHTDFKANWFSAFRHCLENAGRLARIENEEEQRELVRLLTESNDGGHPFFVGGTDLNDEGKWTWDLTGPEVRGYRNWHKGQPDGLDKEHCMELAAWVPERTWNDINCHDHKYFICEIKTDVLIKIDH